MKSANATLAAYLAANQEFSFAELYTFVLNDGSVYRFSNWDADLACLPDAAIAAGISGHSAVKVGNPLIVSAPAGFGSALRCDKDNYIFLSGAHPDFDLSGLGDKTVEYRIRMNVLGSQWLGAAGETSAAADTQWYMGMYQPVAGNARPYFTAFDGINSVTMDSGLNITDSNWHSLRVAKSGLNFYMLWDGALVSSGSLAAALKPITRITPVCFGNRFRFTPSGASQVNGQADLDEFRVSNLDRGHSAYMPATAPFAYDANTLCLLHADAFAAWQSNQILFERQRVSTRIGLEVAQMEVKAYAGPGNLMSSLPFFQAVARGALDKAMFKFEIGVMSSPGVMDMGLVTQFLGKVGDVQLDRTKATLTVNSAVEQLSMQLPRLLYQAGCHNTLYDAGCTLSAAAFKVSSTVASGSTRSTINCSLAQAAGYFTLGKIQFTSGPNTGAVVSVKSYSPGVFQLAFPLLNAPTVGDAFDAYPGCDKTMNTCNTKFANLSNFGGQPFIPAPETAV